MEKYGGDFKVGIDPAQFGYGALSNFAVFTGDSLMQGSQCPHPPSYYITFPSFNGNGWFGPPYFNQSTSGLTVGRMIFDPQIPSQAKDSANNCDELWNISGGLNLEIFWACTNDVATGIGAAATQALIEEYLRRKRAIGVRTIQMPLISRAASGGVNFDAARAALHGYATATDPNGQPHWKSYTDYYIDLEGTAPFGIDGGYANTTYYQADQTHLKDAGYQLAASYMQSAINTLLTSLAGAQTRMVGLVDLARRVAKLEGNP